jgi:hypothetical protein
MVKSHITKPYTQKVNPVSGEWTLLNVTSFGVSFAVPAGGLHPIDYQPVRRPKRSRRQPGAKA